MLRELKTDGKRAGQNNMNNVSNVVLNGAVKKVTRLEIIDHNACSACGGTGMIQIMGQSEPLECPSCHGLAVAGRDVIFFDADKEIELDVQDEGRTLKVFIKYREQA